MKKIRRIFFLVAFMILIVFANKCYATNLDEIENYEVTVEPRLNDGTLDITYEITWKVLDSTTEGPLSWVQIGTPNENVDQITALSSNILGISQYNDCYVKIIFKKSYTAGEEFTFKYKIHQSCMYKLSIFGNCNYSFTPAWFTDAEVKNMTIKWNKDKVNSSNAKTKDGSYLVWKKTNLSEGAKVTAKIKYRKSDFGYLSKNMQSNSSMMEDNNWSMIIFVFLFTIGIILVLYGEVFSGGYYGHRGFYGGYGYYNDYYYGGFHHGCVHSGCAHSSCAHSSCAHSSCACACAGSGRAGCSKKDFYGVKFNRKLIN